MGFNVGKTDTSLFALNSDKTQLIVPADIIATCNEEVEIQKFIQKLGCEFTKNDLGKFITSWASKSM